MHPSGPFFMAIKGPMNLQIKTSLIDLSSFLFFLSDLFDIFFNEPWKYL